MLSRKGIPVTVWYSHFNIWFKNADGTRGVVGDSHEVFTEIESSQYKKVPDRSIQAFQVRVSSES